MSLPQNQAAFLDKVGTKLRVGIAPMPIAGSNEIIVKNAAIAVAPLDCHMQDVGVFIQHFPSIFGCDVAGEVHEVGSSVQRFKKGDRVVGHAIGFVSGRPEDGAFALYTVIPADKAAILPTNISFTDGVVLPMAVEAAVCALSLKIPGVALPGVSTPALGLPYPMLEEVPALRKTLVVYGGSSSVGSMTIQLAKAAGIHVISIAGSDSVEFNKKAGAAEVLDYKDPSLVDNVVAAISRSGYEFIGIFDAIASSETYVHDLAILAKSGGGHLACSHPPPAEVPENVKAGMIFGVNDIAGPVWNDYVTPALESGKLKCIPPATVVGNGLEYIQEALEKLKAGVHRTKLVITI